jgi:glycosyltransferase 2 family protein
MARPRFRQLAITAVKTAVAVVVLWAIGRHVLRTYVDLRGRSESLHFDPLWLTISGVLYLAGLLACAVFFQHILRSSNAPIRFLPAWRAYIVSHLGKYVPGKAMVVVLRSGIVVPYGGRASTAAIATFYETLVMMCAGCLVAAIGFAGGSRSERIPLALWGWGPIDLPIYRVGALTGLALALAFLIVVLPPVFGRVAGLVALPIPGVGPDALPRITHKLLGQGLFWSSGGWILLGLSQLAVIRSFDPAGADAVAALGLAPVVIASVALATVAGFVVAVLPGGLGVREGVLMSALSPALGNDHAVVAALSLRLVWVAAEIAAAAVFFPWSGRRPAAAGPASKSAQQDP